MAYLCLFQEWPISSPPPFHICIQVERQMEANSAFRLVLKCAQNRIWVGKDLGDYIKKTNYFRTCLSSEYNVLWRYSKSMYIRYNQGRTIQEIVWLWVITSVLVGILLSIRHQRRETKASFHQFSICSENMLKELCVCGFFFISFKKNCHIDWGTQDIYPFYPFTFFGIRWSLGKSHGQCSEFLMQPIYGDYPHACC